jgi:hypothetical protein
MNHGKLFLLIRSQQTIGSRAIFVWWLIHVITTMELEIDANHPLIKICPHWDRKT